MRVLVTRPEPAASRTAGRLRALGHEPIVAPLLIPRAVAWELPPGDWQAVAFTSAAAPALGGDLAALAHLPAYAVGAATGEAARAAGFCDVRVARGDASAVFAQAAGDGVTRLLHLAGADRSAAVVPEALSVGVVTVYAADLAEALPAEDFDLALLYSARTAARFAALFSGDPAAVRIAALSPAIAAAAGTGWAAIAVAAEPTEDALFAAARLACE
ncbi:uroporphyrinogen-III synthase [Glacieibacterium frigidum]|uniref:Uroporphyrinogen III synthase HEM4 n=1 Tax=Glacieibacterium frigidum TaxID=2593303 RepID=A0A552UFD0_9SPHN|nr:uroporphyrinogen-III synthase [Glacieibacterium frigidum]TRW16904.1 uroporphyrinogen III synthase HEM4 [Glacieibacterium frigidum]